ISEAMTHRISAGMSSPSSTAQAESRDGTPLARGRHDLDEALQLHRDGDLAGAEVLDRAILTTRPWDGHAIHMLAVVTRQQGTPSGALELIGRAMALRPGGPVFLANAALAYRALGRLDEAAECCRAALRLRPDFPEAADTLGLIWLAQGRAEAAVGPF